MPTTIDSCYKKLMWIANNKSTSFERLLRKHLRELYQEVCPGTISPTWEVIIDFYRSRILKYFRRSTLVPYVLRWTLRKLLTSFVDDISCASPSI